MGDGSKGEKIAGSKGNTLKRVGAEDVRPSGGKLGRCGDPEALVRMVNNKDSLVRGRTDFPSAPEEFDGVG